MSEFDKKISALVVGGDSAATDQYVIARADGSNYKIAGAVVAAAATKVGTLADLAVTGAVTLGSDVVVSRGAANRLDLASGDSLNLVSGSLKIAGNDVLSATTLGTGVTASSLTSVGTLTALTVSGNLTVDTDTLSVDATNNIVRIGTTTNFANARLIANISSNAVVGSVVPILRLSNNGAGNISKLMFSDNSNGDAFITHVAGSAFDATTRYLGFGVDAFNQMVLNANGNLGVGVTPSAWNSGAKALQLGNGASLYATSSGIGTFLGNNIAWTDSGDKYITTAAATLYGQNSSGQHIWFNAPSGTAGNAITFTQAMTLDASGNLLTGGKTTATANGGDVQVSSGITFPATQVAKSDVNTLDDYEEGVFTPTIAFGGASAGVTYVTDYTKGTYTKIGNRVYVSGFVVLSNKGSSSGDATVAGLPFTSASGNDKWQAATVGLAQVSFANQYYGRLLPNTTAIDLAETTEAGVFSYLSNADFANNSEVLFSAHYTVA